MRRTDIELRREGLMLSYREGGTDVELERERGTGVELDREGLMFS